MQKKKEEAGDKEDRGMKRQGKGKEGEQRRRNPIPLLNADSRQELRKPHQEVR